VKDKANWPAISNYCREFWNVDVGKYNGNVGWIENRNGGV